jgi:hypothetical protein
LPSPSVPDPFPWEDDQTPGLSIRPLTHGDLEALLAQLNRQADAQPLAAVRPPGAPESIWCGSAIAAVGGEHDTQPESFSWDDPTRLAGLSEGHWWRRRRTRGAGGGVLSDRPADALDPNRRPQQGARYGLPGGSALAEYQQRRKDELAAQLPSLPLRLAGVATAGLAAGFLAARLVIPLAVAPVVVVVAGWLLRPKLSDGTVAWRRGARGERATARRLRRLQRAGWTVFHDVALQGSRANLDHLLIGPGGVFVIDSKYYRGRIRVGRGGALWYGRHPLGDMLRAVQWKAGRATRALASPGITVEPLVCVHRGQLPWGQLQGPVPILTPTQLVARLASLPPRLTPKEVAQLARQAMGRLRPATIRDRRTAPEQGGIGG